MVVPSLDAGGEPLFHLVNRPQETIFFDQMLAGLIAFRREYTGRLWLEVFVVAAFTVFEHELASLQKCVALIQPDRVQLNTVTRPPAEDYATSVSPDRLATIAKTFEPPAEVIGSDPAIATASGAFVQRDDILALVRRRPCSVDDIAAGLGIHRNEVLNHLEELAHGGLVQIDAVDQRHHYRIASRTTCPRNSPPPNRLS